jgi:hypothetical protein
MTQYVDKSAVVAEIRKRLLPVIRDKHYDEWEEGQDSERKAILAIINTLEVKEVDLEKEFDNYTKDISACDIQFEPFTQLKKCAKYFYELGLKSKGE